MTGTAPDPLVTTLVALAERADLAADLAAATAPARPAADAALAARAATLGRRRLRARTVARTGGVLVAASVLVGGTVAAFPDAVRRVPVIGSLVPVPAPTADPQPPVARDVDPYARLLDGPARGALAGDDGLRTEAFAAWATARRVSPDGRLGVFDDLRGTPHVVWAGQTQTGPAAVVAQRAFLHPHPGLDAADLGERTLLGFVATGPGGHLTLLAVDRAARSEQVSDDPARRSAMVGVWLDEARSRLLLVDPGVPLVWSSRWSYRPDGIPVRDWAPVTFSDGATVLSLPDGSDARLVAVARTPVRDWPDVQRLGPDRRSDQVVPNWVASAATVRWAGTTRCLPIGLRDVDASACERWVEALVSARMDRTGPGGVAFGSVPGRLVGRTPDGRTYVVATLTVDADPSRVVGGVLTGADPEHVTASALVDGGVLDPDAALPVAVRLPERQGWVVASVGAALRYRVTPSGSWTDAGRDAALLPDADRLEVEVTRDGTTPVVVTLGG
ncbi:hypothetical protein [Kineosporia sp. A_224]|uniref:hypothetical protein n=1 Tax=Kineosporia sp. A_224 TaxID=1962180 RepID=UPI000B4C1EF3|nr:hypothetical protein [Kineosporia sp. A_224]